MATYLLDTNHTSPLVTFHHPLRRHILQKLESGDHFFVSAPKTAETLFGIGILPHAKQNLAEWARLKPLLPCLVPE